MEHLFSPWRARHLERMADAPASEGPADRDQGPSVFSQMAAEDRDEENLILWRGGLTFVIMNLYPYNNGHLMIVPFREVYAYEALTGDEQGEIAHTIARCIGWLKAALRPDGFNVGMNLGGAAGAGIPQHLHVHIVPRWNADTNFMPAIGGVKVIPEALSATYDKLRAAIRDTPESPAP
jgi:ATP adenylyltransferase